VTFMPDSVVNANLYPIQATFIAVRELHFVAHRPPSPSDRIDQSSVRITKKVGPFNAETKLIQITLIAELGFDAESTAPAPPFSVKVAITAEFCIGDAFPRDKIAQWAATNSAFVIFPYLRERLYYITVQAGYPPICLPLLQIPSFKVEPVPSEAVVPSIGSAP